MTAGCCALFHDRADAGRHLAASLGHLKDRHPLIMALPRGGVPVAFEVARALDADLDLVFVRKLGAPGHAELGIGAVVDGADPQLVLNEDLVRQISPGDDYIAGEMRRQLAEIDRRRKTYLGGRASIDPAGRTVIVVDDGIATGGTARAALKGLRRLRPAHLVLAIPVAPPDTVASLAGECEGIVCLAQPEPFYAVGVHYEDFLQTGDDEVVQLLSAARTSRQRSGRS